MNLLDQTITSTTDGQQRFMFLTETDIRYLEDYLASIDNYNLDYFLLSNSNQPIAYHHLTKPLKHLSTYFNQSITFRKLRNSFIVSCLQ